LKTNALNIHKQLYQNLISRVDTNRYTNYLKDELGISNMDDCIFSTAEHIAPFNTKNTVSFLLPQLLLQDFKIVEKKSVVILGCSLVPLDNIDYPGGFYQIDKKKKAFNLFSLKYKKTIPFLNDSLTYENIQNKSRDNFFQEFKFLKKEFQLHHESFAHQQSNIMKSIVQEWSFNSAHILIKPLEYVAKNILIKLLKSDDTSINLLFENIEIFKQDTYNIFCSWTETKGTFLFWEVEEQRLNRIVYEEQRFIGENIQFTSNRKEILKLLIENRILPSVSLSLFVVSWLPNIPIAGGHRQYWYWQYMIESFDKIFKTKSKKELSQFGYNQLDFSKLEILSNYGTGLDLAVNNIDKKRLFKDVFDLPIYKSDKKDGFYGD